MIRSIKSILSGIAQIRVGKKTHQLHPYLAERHHLVAELVASGAEDKSEHTELLMLSK